MAGPKVSEIYTYTEEVDDTVEVSYLIVEFSQAVIASFQTERAHPARDTHPASEDISCCRLKQKFK